MTYEKSKETKSQIINATIDMIYEEGIENISLNKILKKSETSKGSFYHQFASLEDLMNNVFKKVADYFFKGFELSANQMSKENLKSIGEKLIYGNVEQDRISAVLFVLISRSFSNNDLKNELIEFRERNLISKGESYQDRFVMLFDILVIGFLAQRQFVDAPDKLLNLWNHLVDELIV